MSEKGSSGMHFDKTINVGQIITMGVMLVGIVAAYYSIRYDVELVKTLHEDRIGRLEATQHAQKDTNQQMLETLTAIKTDIAVMRIQMSRADARESRGEPK
jgi:hypothetical protein